jgi:hypothetical protein
MIVRQFGLRQGELNYHYVSSSKDHSYLISGRNLSETSRRLLRFSSTETTTTTTTITAEEAFPLTQDDQLSSTVTQTTAVSSTPTEAPRPLKARTAFVQAARQRESTIIHPSLVSVPNKS